MGAPASHNPNQSRASLAEPRRARRVLSYAIRLHTLASALLTFDSGSGTTEDPQLCKTLFGFGDADLATAFGGPATTDWNGHGSWIGGNIGGALDDQGINGIAPQVRLVALKISQWCGAAFDSEILDAFLYAADHCIEVVTADGTTAFEAFSIASNWAVEIPCFVFTGAGFPADQCYWSIQGTSMAAPHAVAIAVLAASAFPIWRDHPFLLKASLEVTAEDPASNTTRPLSATDLSAGDLTGVLRATGYCHNGGAAILKNDAYGAGLVNAQRAVGDW